MGFRIFLIILIIAILKKIKSNFLLMLDLIANNLIFQFVIHKIFLFLSAIDKKVSIIKSNTSYYF